jgi:hypothetical protein
MDTCARENPQQTQTPTISMLTSRVLSQSGIQASATAQATIQQLQLLVVLAHARCASATAQATIQQLQLLVVLAHARCDPLANVQATRGKRDRASHDPTAAAARGPRSRTLRPLANVQATRGG